MRIVSRHLLVEFLSSSAAVLLALLVTWTAGDSLRHLDELSHSWQAGLQQLVLGAIEVVPFGVPLACVVGAVWTLTRAARHRELTAIRAGGIPLKRALIPVLLGSACVAVGLGFFEDRILIPVRILLVEAGDSGSEEEDAERRPSLMLDRFWHANASSVFSAASYQRGDKTLTDVTVFRIDPKGEFSVRIDADSALNLNGDTWEFRDLHIRRFDAVGGIDQREAVALRVDLGLSSIELDNTPPPAQLLSLHKLTREVREFTGAGPDRAVLETALHSRLLGPLAVLILVLFAIPHAIGDRERTDSLPRALLQAIGWAMVFWFAWAVAIQLAQRGTVPAFAPLWAVALGALTLGAWRYRRVAE